MTDREKYILRAALIYAQSNLADMNEAYSIGDDEIVVSEIEGKLIEEYEIEAVLATLKIDCSRI